MTMIPNASHLESNGPVAMGRTRASQDHFDDKNKKKVLCINVHGDASFNG